MLHKSLPQPILCLITDIKRYGYSNVHDTVKMAVEGGVNMVQIREKDMAAKNVTIY